MFGVGLAAEFLLRRLSIPDMDRRPSRILDGNCRGVLSDDALLAMDLDDLRDLRMVKEFLRNRT